MGTTALMGHDARDDVGRRAKRTTNDAFASRFGVQHGIGWNKAADAAACGSMPYGELPKVQRVRVLHAVSGAIFGRVLDEAYVVGATATRESRRRTISFSSCARMRPPAPPDFQRLSVLPQNSRQQSVRHVGAYEADVDSPSRTLRIVDVHQQRGAHDVIGFQSLRKKNVGGERHATWTGVLR